MKIRLQGSEVGHRIKGRESMERERGRQGRGGRRPCRRWMDA